MTHEEELISRIWQHVYGLRAELIAVGRRDETEDSRSQVEDYRQAALQQQRRLQTLLAEYRDTYGELIRHGEAEYASDALERLTHWRL